VRGGALAAAAAGWGGAPATCGRRGRASHRRTRGQGVVAGRRAASRLWGFARHRVPADHDSGALRGRFGGRPAARAG